MPRPLVCKQTKRASEKSQVTVYNTTGCCRSEVARDTISGKILGGVGVNLCTEFGDPRTTLPTIRHPCYDTGMSASRPMDVESRCLYGSFSWTPKACQRDVVSRHHTTTLLGYWHDIRLHSHKRDISGTPSQHHTLIAYLDIKGTWSQHRARQSRWDIVRTWSRTVVMLSHCDIFGMSDSHVLYTTLSLRLPTMS